MLILLVDGYQCGKITKLKKIKIIVKFLKIINYGGKHDQVDIG